MKRLIAVLAVLSIFALSAPVTADQGIDTKKTIQPTINYTWGSGTNSTAPKKTNAKNIKMIKGQNIKNAGKDYKKPSGYIK